MDHVTVELGYQMMMMMMMMPVLTMITVFVTGIITEFLLAKMEDILS